MVSYGMIEHGSAVLIDEDTGDSWIHLAGLLPVTRPEEGDFKPLESRVYYVLG
jgi:hypothetical protein